MVNSSTSNNAPLTSLISDSLWVLSSQITAVMMGFISSMLLARALGPDGLGAYAAVVLMITTIGNLANPGIYAAANYHLSSKIFSHQHVFVLSIFITFPIAIVVLLSIGFSSVQDLLFPIEVASEGIRKTVAIAVALTILGNTFAGVTAGAGQISRMSRWLLGLTIIHGVSVLGVSILESLTLSSAIVLYSAFQMSIAIVKVVLAIPERFADICSSLSFMSVKTFFLYGLKVYSGRVLTFFSERIDTYLVLFLLGQTALGYYTLAVSLITQMKYIPISISQSMMPNIGALSYSDATNIVKQASQFTFVLMLICGVFFGVVGYFLIPVLYGIEFVVSRIPFVFMILGVVVCGIYYIVEPYFQSRRRPLTPVFISLISSIVSGILCLVFISLFDIVGAALSFMLSYWVQMILTLLMFQRHSGISGWHLIDVKSGLKTGMILIRKVLLRKPNVLIVAILIYALFATQQVKAAYVCEDASIQYTFYSKSRLEDIVRGEIGQGVLIYSVFEGEQSVPRIAVEFEKSDTLNPSTARVYVPLSNDEVPVVFEQDGNVTVSKDAVLAIEMIATDGWWVRDGVVNYNLDITIYGHTTAMWGAELTGWPILLETDEISTKIIVRDVDSDGLPDWDWRTMMPEFDGRGDYRTNYAEKQCETPVVMDYGISPEWPFIAFEGGFEQSVGVLRPPIVVDWESGNIQYFSELVPVRGQNCSYSMYSIYRVEPDIVNQANFETPFAFYDLSGEGIGHPNLLLRTQRTIENDEWVSIEGVPETQNIRYSWRNQVGDGLWDYKVDVFGRYEYETITEIADGEAWIVAPSYEMFPDWVVSKDWSAVTFVDIENIPYKSSEGIYVWGVPSLVGWDYCYGMSVNTDLTSNMDIQTGIRGEYRFNTTAPPVLYMSPIDNRLHLKWAEQGVWHMNIAQLIRVDNLDRDAYIDVWALEETSLEIETEGQFADDSSLEDNSQASTVIETLYALEDYLLHVNDAGLTILRSDYEPALFETLPPSDHDTWEAHRTQLAPYEELRRDPTDLKSWLDAFPGLRMEISGAAIEHVRHTEDGFRFELTLSPQYKIMGDDVLGILNQEAGTYLVENHAGTITISPLAEPELRMELLYIDEQNLLRVQLDNIGLVDVLDAALVVEFNHGSEVPVPEPEQITIDLFAGETTQEIVDIPFPLAGDVGIVAQIQDDQGNILASEQFSLQESADIEQQVGIMSQWQVVALLVIFCLLGGGITLNSLLSVNHAPGAEET